MTNFSTHALQDSGNFDANLRSGTKLRERYLIMGVLGVGGMGAVYKARDLNFTGVNKLVAVKEMINLAPDPTLRAMIIKNFEREGNLLATLSHPAIPKISDLFNQEDHAYLVMEYIEGKDLEAVLNDTPGFLPEATIVEWAIQLCDVLTYLHSNQPEPIVFRDMKPSNVMLDQLNNIRLIDFGIAKGFQAGQKGTMIGTEGYSPPEQYRGEAGPAGDLYALGATMHHLLTKRDPRAEPPFSFAERPIRKINPSVSPSFEAIVNKSLSYNPADRFPSAAAMKEVLVALQRGAQVVVSVPTTNPNLGTSVLPGTPALPAGGTATLPSSSPMMPTGQETGLLVQAFDTGIKPLWVFKCEDEIRSQPLPVGKFVYVSVYDNNLYALSRDGGKFVWKYASEGGFAASPIHDSGNVYIGSEDGKLYALTGETGRPLWSYQTGESIRCTARAAQGHIFVGSDDRHLHAINMQGGRKAWVYETPAPVRSRPFVLEKEARVFFGCEAGEFYCLDFSGSMKWRYRSKRAITSSPNFVDGLIIVGSADYHIHAIEASSGWGFWKARTQKPVVSSPAVTEKAIYIGSADNNLYALSVRDGKVLWKYETGDQIASSPAIYKNAIYFGSVDGYVYCIELKDGKLRWKFKTDGAVISSPSIVDDVLYIGSTDHNLYALSA